MEWDQDVREALRCLPGWYVLIRSPGGNLHRVPFEFGDDVELERDDESGQVTIAGEVSVVIRPEWLVAGLMVRVGVFHPVLQPEPTTR
jgi:hypothetical protein